MDCLKCKNQGCGHRSDGESQKQAGRGLRGLALDGAGEFVFDGLTAIDSGFHFHKRTDSHLIDLEVGSAKVCRRPTVLGRRDGRHILSIKDFAVLFTVSAVLGNETLRVPLNSPNAALQGDQMGRAGPES